MKGPAGGADNQAVMSYSSTAFLLFAQNLPFD
jgi:hypothetical protein